MSVNNNYRGNRPAAEPERPPMLFEAIDWRQVAASLEQSTSDYASRALLPRQPGAGTYAIAALVTDALTRAIRGGLE